MTQLACSQYFACACFYKEYFFIELVGKALPLFKLNIFIDLKIVARRIESKRGKTLTWMLKIKCTILARRRGVM